jgi:hypothetical protein
MEERRLARLVVPGSSAGTVVVDAAGRLPSIEFTLVPGDTTVFTLVHSILPALGLGDRVLDCFVNQTDLPPPDDPVPVLVELPPQAERGRLPEGWRELPIAGAGLDVESPLRAKLQDWIDTHDAPPRVDPLRPPWGQAGWFEAASEWIAGELADAELPAPIEIAQFRQWGISAVMRVDCAVGRYWFKAVSEHFRREAGVTAFLHRQAPGSVAPVIGVDAERGWLLLGDLGTRPGDPDARDLREPFEHLIALQQRLAGRADELLGAGCEPRPLASVPRDFARVLDDPVVREWLDVPDHRVRRLIEWLDDAVHRIDALELPDLLVHGDFHPGNVAHSDGRRVIFDWSDAAISKPFVDVVTWASWMSDDPAGQDALWLTFAELWSDVMAVDACLAMRSTFEGVAGAYHVVSYAGIVRSLDEFRRSEHAIGLVDFYQVLEAAAPT